MASDRYTYVLTESAEADIDEAFNYIANELVNPDAASAFAMNWKRNSKKSVKHQKPDDLSTILI